MFVFPLGRCLEGVLESAAGFVWWWCKTFNYNVKLTLTLLSTFTASSRVNLVGCVVIIA
jgi:hypothetical protein